MLIDRLLDSDGNVDASKMEQLFSNMSDMELEAVSMALHLEQARRLAVARAEAQIVGQRNSPKAGATGKDAPMAGVGTVNRPKMEKQGTRPHPPPPTPDPAREKPYVYVTEYGECFHVRRECISLARSKKVSWVPMPSNRRPCKTCSWHHITPAGRADSV